ncbi:MAG: tRNA (adenosine(37)-N6)-threonylcarbamoyltransferase complex transferase subunit TsaD [Oscillospiraceae bacterium]|nr:tRNA (adenosine(37)-N6)-threonylcarbamoyltransferase complex transferase subunit TsaD [Ruminococcus sp.]MDD7338221.1 tRNA (adenosine(37)-N6)-threonylcarbamoyltransferase complex transferase subunit TsaD [Ruminococcus sp.]MDY6061314.1 tRNA (adenosine(37)-N6)-threonylcarbamoyltransferase complex transferase subunit TsaD [Oscillospiraceae bacterium]
MKILGIESSCDETAASVVEDGRTVLSNIVASQVEEHKIYGGVVPEIASRRHTEAISGVVRAALGDAGCTIRDIDAVAVTYAPGLIGALLVGVNFAKGLSYSSERPLVPVHHLRSHIASNYISHTDLKPPFLCLVVSGGHSHIIEVKDYTDFKIIGYTHDDAAGEAMDKAARAMGLPYPGGLNLDKAAANGDPKAFKLPHPRVDGAPYDFSFSGLKTAVLNIINSLKQKGEEVNVPDLGASYINAVVDCLCGNTQKAAENLGYKKIVLAGGVSANSVLRRRMTELCQKKNWSLYYPELKYCGDNGAMVAAQGYYEFVGGNTASLDLNAVASLSIE